MHRFVWKIFNFAESQIRKYGVQPEKNAFQVKKVDKSKNIVYGGDLPIPIPRQSVGSLMFERLSQPERSNDILQICTSTKYGVTTKKFLEHAVALAERLQEEGIKKGDVIGLVGDNSLNMNTAVAGIFFIGAIPFPITHKTSIEEFKIVLKKVRPKYFACDEINLFTLQQVLRAVGNYENSRLFLLDSLSPSSEANIESFKDFIKGRGQNVNSFKPATVDKPEDELALIVKGARQETYGKGIGITHYNLCSVIARIEASNGVDIKKKVVLMVQKVMWMSGVYCLLKAFALGAKVVVMREFDEESFLQAIEDYKVTSSYIYMSKLWQLYKRQYSKDYDLSSCEYLQAFDGPLPPSLVKGLKDKLGLVLRPSYGINEVTGLALEAIDLKGSDKDTYTGELVPQMYGKILSDSNFQKAGPYGKGEICFKGPAVTKGYINDTQSNRRLFDKEGFLLTGLFGYYDNDGYFFVIDKIIQVIMYKGREVSPRQLEGIIKSLEPVKDALVAGIKHPTDGFYPMAFVTLQKGMNMTAEEIIDYVNGKVEDHQKLRGGVVFIPKIPRSRDTGALRRNLIKKVLSKYQIRKEVGIFKVTKSEKQSEKAEEGSE